ncbi:putative helicase [Tanacetum coccineum]
MNGGSLTDHTVNPTLSSMLNKFVFLASNTIIGQDGKVHSYCSLRLADIPASGTDIKQSGTSSASKYAHTRLRRRAAGVLAVYHNLGPPSYQCSMYNATMWYNERSVKAKKDVTPTFSLCCQEGKVLLPRFNDTPQPLKLLLDYNDPTTSTFKDQIRNKWPKLSSNRIPSSSRRRSPKQQKNQGTTLLRGGRLFQQYLVHAFTAIEEQHLNWTQNNQDTLRVDLYHNLCDVMTRGDTSAAGLGKRIVLPWTFIGSPRYMMQNYQDAMALCRAYGNPDLFITFTSKPKWPEIGEMLAYVPGQKSHDRPEVGTWVFKMKLTELLEDLTKNKIFRETYAGLDRANIAIQENVRVVANGASEEVMEVDEIKNYLNCRFLAPCEATWRLFSFDIHYSYPIVMQLNYHLPDQNTVTLRDFENFPALLEREGINLTMFTEWFELNKEYPEAREYTYAEIPQHYVWHAKEKKWMPRKQKKCIGKIIYSTLASGERYYLRMLLNVVRGAQSFKELKMVNKINYATSKVACFAYGLLNDDKEWTHAILEASF